MIEKYYNDYYRGKIKQKDICKIENINKYFFNKEIENQGLKSYINYYKEINFDDDNLNKVLREKYSSIVDRCNGGCTDKYGHYNGLDYLTIQEWANFVNKNKNLIFELWLSYLSNDKKLKYAISVDRINNNKGYIIGNIQLVSHGFNSWKNKINPIKIIYNSNTFYFMSCEESSKITGFSKRHANLILNNKINNKKYDVYKCNVEEVLNYYDLNDIDKYYELYIKGGDMSDSE